jgi:RNA polymerase sigma-70 factor (ECF subfamily)
MSLHSQAFESIYSRLYKTVYYFVLSKISDTEVASDLTQEVFLSAYRSWTEIPEQDTARKYLYIIARSRLIDYFRSAHRRHSFVPQMEDDESFFDQIDGGLPLQEDIFKESEHKAQALQILNTLKASDRDILVAKFIQDLSYKEISEVFGISEESARKKVERALKKARDIKTN